MKRFVVLSALLGVLVVAQGSTILAAGPFDRNASECPLGCDLSSCDPTQCPLPCDASACDAMSAAALAGPATFEIQNAALFAATAEGPSPSACGVDPAVCGVDPSACGLTAAAASTTARPSGCDPGCSATSCPRSR